MRLELHWIEAEEKLQVFATILQIICESLNQSLIS